MASMNSDGRRSCLSVVDEEVLEREVPPLVAAPQDERAAERDQRRRHVADRRAIGDVAADGAGVADQRRTNPLDQSA